MTDEVIENVEDAVEVKKTTKRGKKFDSSKEYATVHGGLTKAVYFQDGSYFDVDGKPCEL